MSIVTFTTDYGNRDYHVAIAKAQLINWAPASIPMDIASNVSHFDIIEAAYLLRSCWKSFPMGTIHIIGVKSHLKKMPLLVLKDNQYFIGADNGVFHMIFDDGPDEVWRIDLPLSESDVIFPLGGVFVQTAAHLVRGGNPSMIARVAEDVEKIHFPMAYMENGGVRCNVIHIDDYGNMILNITRKMFEEWIRKRSFTIHARSTQKSGMRAIMESFQPEGMADGIPFAVWGANDFLVIAMRNASVKNGGGAARLLGYQKMSNIFIEIHD
jgi:S-adenosylmethionine hydrolase